MEGLRVLLTAEGWENWYHQRPSLLIISDASGYAGNGERLVINPSVDEVLLRASAIQFDTLHRLLYAELTGYDDLPVEIRSRAPWRQYFLLDYPQRWLPRGPLPADPAVEIRTPDGVIDKPALPRKLATIVVPSTLRETGEMLDKLPACGGPLGDDAPTVQDRVARLTTLQELPTADAKAAFWLGCALGQICGQAITCARAEIAGGACEAAPDTPATCPPDVHTLLGQSPSH